MITNSSSRQRSFLRRRLLLSASLRLLRRREPFQLSCGLPRRRFEEGKHVSRPDGRRAGVHVPLRVRCRWRDGAERFQGESQGSFESRWVLGGQQLRCNNAGLHRLLVNLARRRFRYFTALPLVCVPPPSLQLPPALLAFSRQPTRSPLSLQLSSQPQRVRENAGERFKLHQLKKRKTAPEESEERS